MGDSNPRWEQVKFGEVVRLNRETCKNPAAHGITRAIGLEHLEPGAQHVRLWSEISDDTAFTQRVRPGQVLFGKRRAYQKKVSTVDFDAVCSGDIYAFESANPRRLLPELLPFLCQTQAFFEYAVGTSAGSLSPRTNWSSLSEYAFSLPPIEEQSRIVAAGREFFTLTEHTSRLVKSSEILLRSGLNSLFFFPAIPRRQMITGAPGWKLRAIAELADTTRPISYGILLPGDSVEDGVPMLRVMDFDDFGQRTETEVLRVSAKVADTSKTTYCRAGDLVVSVMATIGRTFVIPPEMDGWNMNRALTLIPTSDNRISKLLHAYFQSGFIKNLLNAEKIGSAQARINLADLKTLPVPVPTDIDAILERIDQLFAMLDAARERHNLAVDLSKRFLAEAFP